MAVQYPKYGDSFSSTTSFRLAAHRAALSQGVKLKALGSTGGSYSLGRCLTTISSPRYIGDGIPCSFAFRAVLVNEASSRVEVVSACLEHTCPASTLEVRSEAAVEWEREKIRELEELEQIEAEEARQAAVVRRAMGHVAQDERASGTGLERVAEDDEQSLPKSSSSTSSKRKKASKQELYPRAVDLSQEIAVLLKRGPVSFPSPTTSFPSASALLVHLTENGGERCSSFAKAVKKREGDWRVVASALEHNHALSGNRRNEAAKKRLTKPVAPPLTTSSSSPSSTPHGPSSSPSSSTPAFSSAKKPDLATGTLELFFTTVVPPTLAPAVPPLAPLLASAGVSSVDDLVSVLFLDDSAIIAFIETLRERGTSDWLCAAVAELFELTRTGFESLGA
ncbi:hypothetical protein JCM8097_005529 [Rhodosporidiobolus ruineniae]